MLRILNEEGHEIKERELMRVRAKNRWLLRVPNGNKSKKRDPDQDVISQLQAALYPDAQGEDDDAEIDDIAMPPPAPAPRSATRAPSPPLSPEVLAKRKERFEKLQAESAERWASRKRRRRTRGWAGLPADPPGPPRFPSETTIDESKQFLNLDSRMYRDVRARFQRICEAQGIIKKTIAGPEKWEAAKDMLIQESPHLQTVFWGNNDDLDTKKLALDVVCGDVTKRMRTLERRMTIAEAKNTLGVNPEESRQLRNAFYQTLKADHFTSKLEAGEDHWKELKQQWINGSQLLQNLLAPGDADPRHGEKVKAMEVLCRDVMKRLRDDQTKRDPTRRKSANFNAGDSDNDFNSPATTTTFQNTTNNDALVQTATHAQAQVRSQQPQRSQAQTQARQAQPQSHTPVMVDHNNMQIDPSLLLAAANDPSLLPRTLQSPYSSEPYTHDGSYSSNPTFGSTTAAPTVPSHTIAVYFRLHPASDIQTNNRLWVSTLASVSVDELRQLTAVKFPGSIAIRIEGVIKQANGHEMTLPIDQDEELEAYLVAIQGVKPVFSVQLVVGWKNG